MSGAAAAWSQGIRVIGVHDPRPSRAGHDLVRQPGAKRYGLRNDEREERHGG